MSKYVFQATKEKELLPVPWVPHNYQKKAVAFLIGGGLGLFLDPGLGKTSIVLAAILILIKKGFAKKTLVIAPLRVCYSVWPSEARSWVNFNPLRVGVLHGKNKEKVLKEDLDIYVINPEGLQWLFKTMGAGPLFDILVVDESTSFKHTNTLRFKVLKPHLKKFKYRWVLTGTPMSNGYLDLFGQVYISDLGVCLGSYITHYKRKYFTLVEVPIMKGILDTGRKRPKWSITPRKEEEIQELLKGKFLRMDGGDYLELPEVIYNNVKVDLPAGARKLYNELEKKMISEWGGNVITAMNAGSAYNKCRQISSGGLYAVSDEWVPGTKQKLLGKEVHDEKTKALEEIINEANGTPVLVAFWYKHSKQRILKALGLDTPSIDGDCSERGFMEIERLWNLGEIPVLLGHPMAMSHGLNLQHSGNIIVWYDIIPDYERYHQFNKRIMRQGSKNRWVFVHHIVSNKTVDVMSMMVLKNKRNTQETFFQSMEDYLQSIK